MKGERFKNVDRGGLGDWWLRAVARWGARAQKRADERQMARRFAAAYPRGTYVRLNSGCHCGRPRAEYGGSAGTRGWLHSYVEDADDYRLTVDGGPFRGSERFDYHEYVCANGFDVLRFDGEQPFVARSTRTATEEPKPAEHDR